MLSVDGVSAGYGRVTVLRDVSLTVGDDELVALVGHNGAGKTTLMKTVTGIVSVASGRIRFAGADISGIGPHKIARRGIAVVPEGRRIFTMLSVRENLLLASRARGGGRHVREDLAFVYEMFPLLEERAGSRGDQLSGGQQQMLALGRTVMQRPRLILMDEPSIGLSPLIVQQLPAMISRVRERTGASILLVEQDAGLALSLASRVYVLERGTITHTGPAEQFVDSELLVEAYLGRGAAKASA